MANENTSLEKYKERAVLQEAIFRPRSAVIIGTTAVATAISIVALGPIAGGIAFGIGATAWLGQAIETIINPSTHTKATTLLTTPALSKKDLERTLKKWFNDVAKQLPTDINKKVKRITNILLDILPHIPDINSSDQNIYMIRQITIKYLPETVNNYLSLSPNLVDNKIITDGKTAKQLFMEQLDLLESELDEMLSGFHRNDSQRLLSHGRFLEEKFGRSDSWLID